MLNISKLHNKLGGFASSLAINISHLQLTRKNKAKSKWEIPSATQLFSVFKTAWMSGELWLTAFSEVESGDCGVNAIFQQV